MVDTSGNIGIGTTAPGEKLHVGGHIKLTGRIKQGALGDIAEMMPLAKCVLGPAGNSLKDGFQSVENSLKAGFQSGPLSLGNSPFRVKSEGALLPPEAGDVVVVDKDGGIRRSSEPLATNVVGIISTNPAQILRDDLPNAAPITLSGIVPCKVTNENGAIQPGDLLVSSSTPGHAMRAGNDPRPGTVVAKALGRLDAGRESGVIEVVVMLR
jgi:hypothetical protein